MPACSRACPGAARLTPRTSGRHPHGRSARSWRPRHGPSPAPPRAATTWRHWRQRPSGFSSFTTASTSAASVRRKWRRLPASATAVMPAIPWSRSYQGPARRRRRRQARGERGLRHRPEPAVRDRLLSRRGRTRRTSTSATPTRSSASPTRTATRRRGAGRDDRQEHPQRSRAGRRRRPLDARPRVLARRQDAVRLGRLAVERQ